jgi:CRISPR-associated protein Csb2
MDVVAREWVAGRPSDPSKLRTIKEVHPKQMNGEGPHVQYIWQVDPVGANPFLEALRIAVHRLHTLGWGIDMAYAGMSDEIRTGIVYRPSVSGSRLAVPMNGTLEDLRSTYERFVKRADSKGVDTHTRPSMLQLQPYRRDGDFGPPSQRFVLMRPGSDLVRAVAWQDCMKVAGWMRHAAAESLRREYPAPFIDGYVLGHTAASDKSQRVSYVPVPSIHGKYSDGQIRRVLIVEPPDSDGQVVRMLGIKLTGQVLTSNDQREECVLAPADREDWVFSQYIPESGRQVWRSVTPVVLHGHSEGRHGAFSIDKTERLLLRAFEMAGIREDQIGSLAFQSAPLWPGARGATAMLVPSHLAHYPRVHVEVRFHEEIRGPVLAGIGRHYGIGLFASVQH